MNSLLLHQLARSLLRRSFQLPLIRATSYLQFGLFLGCTFPEMMFPPASAFRVQYLKKTRSSTTRQFWSPSFRSSLFLFLLSTSTPMIQCNYYSHWATIHLWSDGRPSSGSISCNSFFPQELGSCCMLLRVVAQSLRPVNFFNNRNRGWCVCHIMNLV